MVSKSGIETYNCVWTLSEMLLRDSFYKQVSFKSLKPRNLFIYFNNNILTP